MASPTQLSDANTSFFTALHQKLNEDNKTGNIFYSPFSISSALAMVLLGARGNTATQMSEVLGFTKKPKGQEAAEMMQMQQTAAITFPPQMKQLVMGFKADFGIHVAFCKLLSELNKTDAPYSLSVANRLYGEQSYQFVEEYLNNTAKLYQAELEAVDFKTKSEEARVLINTWVEKQTQNKIKDLLKPGVVDNLTRLVLVNAIYFKGSWAKQFDEAGTRDATFRMNKNNSKTVKMMRQKSKFNISFIPDLNCRILEMPYVGNDLSMIIILPVEIEDDTTGLEKIESSLTAAAFQEWTRPDMMDKEELTVGLPRFKLEQQIDLKDVLVRMGMVDAFSDNLSDFSGMSPDNNLVLSKVIHKAVVEVNEEGTVAAAATAAIMMLRCARPMCPDFIADHPFLFFIRHNPSLSILFAGRYTSPV